VKTRKIGSNQTELQVGTVSVLFSYNTPVAGVDDQGLFRTDRKYSTTTSKHITQYLGGKDNGRVVPQSYIDNLVGE